LATQVLGDDRLVSDPQSASELDDERSYVERSIADLDEERRAGDIDEERYALLRARYESRARAVQAELAALGRPSDPGLSPPAGSRRTLRASPRRRRSASGIASRLSSRRSRLVTGWAAFACLLAAAVLLALSIGKVGPFAPPLQLSVNDRIQIELAEASVLGAKGDVTQALAVYDRVLELDPTQPQALADGGWLARLAGLSEHSERLVRNGDAEIEAAVRASPGDAQARAYEGAMLLEDRSQPVPAASQFQQMLYDHPTPTLLWSFKSIAVRAFEEAHLSVPSPIARASAP
jgi:tetratricopeptide (TPR) repeat protein